MKEFNLKDYQGGWVLGNFKPSLIRNSDIEVGIKTYNKGFVDKPHYHKFTKEYTIILQGKAEICGREVKEGTIIEIEPNEIANFKALTDLITLVIKSPSMPSDKFFVDEK